MTKLKKIVKVGKVVINSTEFIKEVVKVMAEHKKAKIEAERDAKIAEIKGEQEIIKKQFEEKEKTEREKIRVEKEKERTQIQEKEKTEREKIRVDGEVKKEELKTKLLNIDNKKYRHLIALAKEMEQSQFREKVKEIIFEKIIDFVNAKAKFDEEIKNIEFEIRDLNKDIAPLKEEISKIEIDMKILVSSYDELNIRFEKKVEIMQRLKLEREKYSDISKFQDSFKREKTELKNLINEITDKERQLLHKEKEKLNKIQKIEPLLKQLKELKKTKNVLINSKEHFINTEILDMNSNKLKLENKKEIENVIDVNIEEEFKPKEIPQRIEY